MPPTVLAGLVSVDATSVLIYTVFDLLIVKYTVAIAASSTRKVPMPLSSPYCKTLSIAVTITATNLFRTIEKDPTCLDINTDGTNKNGIHSAQTFRNNSRQEWIG